MNILYIAPIIAEILMMIIYLQTKKYETLLWVFVALIWTIVATTQS